MNLAELKRVRSISLKNAAKHKLLTDKLDALEVEPIAMKARFISATEIKATAVLGRDILVQSIYHIDSLMEEDLMTVQI